jgi:hypothetical protein
MGEEHAGHVRLVLVNPADNNRWIIEGRHVIAKDIVPDDVVRVQAHEVFVMGTAATLGLIKGEGIQMEPLGGKKDKTPGILFPHSAAMYVSEEDMVRGEATKRGGMRVQTITLRKKIADQELEEHTNERKEFFKEYTKLLEDLRSLVEAHKGDGMELYENEAHPLTLIIPTSLTAQERSGALDIVARMKKDERGLVPTVFLGIASEKVVDTLPKGMDNMVFLVTPSPEQVRKYLPVMGLFTGPIYIKDASMTYGMEKMENRGFYILDPLYDAQIDTLMKEYNADRVTLTWITSPEYRRKHPQIEGGEISSLTIATNFSGEIISNSSNLRIQNIPRLGNEVFMPPKITSRIVGSDLSMVARQASLQIPSQLFGTSSQFDLLRFSSD